MTPAEFAAIKKAAKKRWRILEPSRLGSYRAGNPRSICAGSVQSASMNIEIKEVEGKWVALAESGHPGVAKPPVATGDTQLECIQNLEQWLRDRCAQGLTPADPV
jgi:hypothetical protein